MKNIDSDAKFRETTVRSEEIFEGKVMHVFRDEVALPDGTHSVREYARHRGAVAVVALDEQENVYLVRQYRYAIGRMTMEIPAGKLEGSDADVSAAARRELSEEIGVEAGRFSYLGIYLPSPAILTEQIHCFLAEDLSFGETHPDDDENLETVRLPLRDAVSLIMDGKMQDGKTLFALQKVYLMKHPL